MGGAALLRKETSESGVGGAESRLDSALKTEFVAESASLGKLEFWGKRDSTFGESQTKQKLF